MDKFKTEHRISSAYHPQTNGQREKDNKTLKDALGKVSNEHCDDWDLFIDEVLFAHRTFVHSSTGLGRYCMSKPNEAVCDGQTDRQEHRQQ